MGIFHFFKKKAVPQVSPAGNTGCAGNFSCQYSNLGKAKDEGKPEGMTYCKYLTEFVYRKKECEFFLSHGCANGICAHKSRSGEAHYCKYYECIIDPTESCPDYLDFFDTPEGEALRNTLIKK